MMSDLDDLGIAKSRPDSLRFNALNGNLAIHRYDPETRRRTVTDLPPRTRWAVDMPTRQRGFGRVTDAIYDMKLSPVGALVPEVPDSDLYKPAVSMLLYSPEWGLVEWQTAAAIAVRAIVGFWDRYKAAPEALDGDIPIIELGEPRVVVMGRDANQREFYAANIAIVAWMGRDVIPAFRVRPPTVAPPQSGAGIALAAPLASRLAAAAAPDCAVVAYRSSMQRSPRRDRCARARAQGRRRDRAEAIGSE